jgi:transketolase
MNFYDAYGTNSRVTARIAQLELARRDERIFSVEDDLGLPDVPFDKEFPERYVQAGIAEADQLGIAAGLAMHGKVPFVNTFAAFATMRACEQLRLDIAYNRANVKIVGYYAGLSGGYAGPTHHCIEDIAITRAIPGITVMSPADSYEAYQAVYAAAEHDGPVYIRASRSETPPVHDTEAPFVMGRAIRLREGRDVTIIGTGCLMVANALASADILAGCGIAARVIDMHTVKPLDEDAILAAAADTGLIATYEDHTVAGGLGSAVASVVLAGHPVPVLPFGVRDEFCSRTAEYAEMLTDYGIGPQSMADVIRRRLEARR